MTKIIYLSSRINSFKTNDNLALKKDFNPKSKKIFDEPKVLTFKLKNTNKLYCLCWQIGVDDDC